MPPTSKPPFPRLDHLGTRQSKYLQSSLLCRAQILPPQTSEPPLPPPASWLPSRHSPMCNLTTRARRGIFLQRQSWERHLLFCMTLRLLAPRAADRLPLLTAWIQRACSRLSWSARTTWKARRGAPRTRLSSIPTRWQHYPEGWQGLQEFLLSPAAREIEGRAILWGAS